MCSILTKSSDGLSGHKSTATERARQGIGGFRVLVPLTLRVKTTAIRCRWFKRSDLLNDLSWYTQQWNNFCICNSWSDWGRGLWGWRKTGLGINAWLGMFLSSRLSGNSKVKRQQSKSDTWFQLTAPREHVATRGREERRSGNVKLMSG